MKALRIAGKVITWISVAVTVLMVIFTFFSVMTFDRNDREVLGHRFYVVQSDSMAKTDFSSGDIVVTKKVNPAELREGDIITFISQNADSYGETVTHKIRGKTRDKQGDPAFITYGTTTGSNDPTPVSYPYVLGKYVFHVPGIGAFFLFLKTTPGYIVCVFVPFLILLLLQGIRMFKLFKKYKREQQEELDDERKQIEEEKKESAEMLKKLEELQRQLAEQQGQQAPAEEAPQPNQ